jgi:hypothetical protein
MRLVKARRSSDLDVHGALYAICSTGRGHCWHCDRKLPAAEEAIEAGWHVQRVKGVRVASIILVCPKCRRKRAGVAERGLLPNLSPPICNTLQ